MCCGYPRDLCEPGGGGVVPHCTACHDGHYTEGAWLACQDAMRSGRRAARRARREAVLRAELEQMERAELIHMVLELQDTLAKR